MNSMNENGCSICAAGEEKHEPFVTRLGGKKVKMIQYDYRTKEGALFSCVGATYEKCVEKRNLWLKNLQK